MSMLRSRRAALLCLDWDAATKYVRFVFLCGWLITEDSQCPNME
jgi:hypothetical protein